MRRHRHGSGAFVEPDLPITPMLDMSFQLLAFFVMTFNPTPTEGHIDVALPAQQGGPSTKLPDPFTEDQVEDLTVRIEADDAGDISAIALTQGKEGAEVAIPGKSKDARTNLFNEMKKRLAAAKADHAARMAKLNESKPFTPPKVKLELADNLSYKVVIAVMDESTRAGYPAVAPVLKDDKK
jgi:biopolymer transport protein ExbD